MPETQNELRQMIRRQLRRRRPPDTKALYGRAVRIDPEIRQLDLRQFNARHVLPVRREMKREEGPGPEEERVISALVKRRLVEEPTHPTELLYDEAVEKAPSLKALSLTQFHERYAVPVKRKLPSQDSDSGEDDRGDEILEVSEPGKTSREDIRRVFFDFARALEGAPDRVGLVGVIGDVGSYVERVLLALRRKDVRS